MPMFDDKRKAAALIIKKIGNREVMGEKRNENGAESDNSIAIESAAQEIMLAVERKDTKMLVNALRSFIDMSEDMEESEE